MNDIDYFDNQKMIKKKNDDADYSALDICNSSSLLLLQRHSTFITFFIQLCLLKEHLVNLHLLKCFLLIRFENVHLCIKKLKKS